MKFHIVGNGESVEDILRGYDLTIDELKNENKHIRIWNNLIPGTKLKIPVLSESIIEDINEIEPFIEDYYPKIKVDEIPKFIEEPIQEEVGELKIEQDNIDVSELMDEITDVNDNTQERLNKETVLMENHHETSCSKKQLYYRYVYPQPYYYRPIIYVIPRR